MNYLSIKAGFKPIYLILPTNVLLVCIAAAAVQKSLKWDLDELQVEISVISAIILNCTLIKSYLIEKKRL